MLWIILAVLAWTALTAPAVAMDVVKALKGEEYQVRYAYHWELLDQVLKSTTAEFGPYIEQPYLAPISVARGHQEGGKGELLNLLISDVGHKILDGGMIPSPFPIDKGLLGYRVSLIARWTQDKINKINTLDELRTLTTGSGSDWGDVRIYRYNNVPVETSQTYEALFTMLIHGRFDLFPRGATEVAQEMAGYGPQYPELAIEQHLLIRYPFAQCFYVSKSEPHLAQRIRYGLEQMTKDGRFEALFNKHFAQPLAALKLSERVIIELKNPYLPAWVPLDRPELWYKPASGNSP